MATGARAGRVRSLVIVPVDVADTPAGGIKGFVRGFVKYAPEEMGIACVAITRGEPRRGVGRWEEMQLEGRTIRHLAVQHVRNLDRTFMPVAVSFTAALLRHRRQLEQEGDVLQFHRPLTAFPLFADRRPKVQVLHYEAGQMTSGGGENRWRRVPNILRWVEDVTVQRMSRVYAVNESTAESLRARRPARAARIQFLSNWVDDQCFHPAGADRQSVREQFRSRLGWSHGAPVVLWVGRLEATKDPLLALEAYRSLEREIPSARLLMIGHGLLREELAARIRRWELADRVHLMGAVPPSEVAEAMRASDVLLVSSVSEAGPTVALEALASGLPVVAPAVGRVPVLVSTGVNGSVADARTPASLARGVRWAIGSAGPATEDACVRAARPYHARTVLEPFYEAHFRLAWKSRAAGRA